MEIVLGLAAALTYGAADFIGGMVSRRAAVLCVVFLSQVVGSSLVAVAFPFVDSGAFDAGALWWGVAAGVAGSAGVIALYHGLSVGRMSVVAPITAVVAAGAPVVVGLALGERPGPLALAGVGLALPAVALVASSSSDGGGAERGEPSVTGVPQAVGAGASFGAFFILLDRAGDGSGLWPLLGARMSSLAVLGLLVAVTSTSLRPGGDVGAGIVGAGLLDVAANLLYLFAVRRGLLSLVAVLTSMYPASTVVLARVVLGERMTAMRLGGLAIAVVGVALIALG
ncbi:MAG TPA: DMT family transporter [Actinomycetota bacterium]|nr:DMT family transporter [Actinomycetota bacterium]